MPNHYTTEIKLKGKPAALQAFMDQHIRKDKEGTEGLDFNTVIPMPEAIKGTESSSTIEIENGLILLGRSDLLKSRFTIKTLESMLDWAWVKEASVTTVEGLKELLLKREPDCVKKAKKHIAAYEQTGFLNWYDWSIAKWGTKWNSYNLKITKTSQTVTIKMDTAWAPPMPVICKLVELHPDLTFTLRGHDEGEKWGPLSFND